MDAAAAVEAADGVGLAPPLHGLGPFLGQVVLGESLQGADELAVDDPGRERIQLAGGRGHPGFVEERQPLLDLAVEDEAARLRDPADGGGSRVTTRTDVDRPPGPLPRAAHVTGQHPLVVAHHRQPRVDRRVALSAEETLGAREPPAHRRHEGGVEEQVHGDANRRSCRSQVVAGPHAFRVRPLPHLDGHIEMACRVGDLGEQRQIAGTDETVCVRLHQQVVGLVPVAHRGTCPCAVQERLTGSVAHRRCNRERSSGNSVAHALGLRVDRRCDGRRFAMPFITVKLIEGVFDADQKREIVEKLTDTMVSIEGENMRR